MWLWEVFRADNPTLAGEMQKVFLLIALAAFAIMAYDIVGEW